jgi:amino acid transporter
MDVGEPRRLRRELNIWEAIGISVALMAPSMAANINPQGTVGLVGRAIPLTFVLATVGVLLVSWTFVRLCQRFSHSGSVYGFVGATLGPRAGVVAGWGLIGTYTFYGVVTSMAAGRIFSAFLEGIGVWHTPPDWAAFVIAALVLAGVYLLTVAPVRRGTRTLLVIEGATVLLILLVGLVVLVRLLAGSAPGGQTVTFSPFTVPGGTDPSTLFLGVVFGFLSFAGFEAAATLGEEAREPRRDIPRAILGTAIFGGLYFIFITWIEVMGFGDDDKGLKAFGQSGALVADLGSTYVGSWLGDLISLGASVSAFGCALACAVGASRLVFALARDGVAPAPIARVSERRGTPEVAAATIVGGMFVLEIIMGLLYRGEESPSLQTFIAAGTIGTLILLVVYVLATIGATRLVFFPRGRSAVTLEIAIPILGLVVLGYTLWRNVIPFPEGSARWLPITATVWLLAALAFVLLRPAVARRAGEQLTAAEGLTATAGVHTGEAV